jgi:hypothetical protein
VRLYANENFPLPAVAELRALGHDVRTMAETGHTGRGVPDEEVLSFATQDRRAVLTLNRRDFIRLAERVSHGGIVACTEDRDGSALARRIHAALAGIEDLSGRVVRIYRPPL